jgi:hypothetical protein
MSSGPRERMTDTGPPGNGKGARQSAVPENKRHGSVAHPSGFGNRDRCIEPYLHYVTREQARLGGDQISNHYLHLAYAAYAELQTTGLPEVRFRTWFAVRTLCQWLAQLEGSASKKPRPICQPDSSNAPVSQPEKLEAAERAELWR